VLRVDAERLMELRPLHGRARYMVANTASWKNRIHSRFTPDE
jgi:hypothetical protein